jgi:predicted phosphodiesterase
MANKIVSISDLHLGQSGADSQGQYSLLSARAEGNLVRAFAAAAAQFAAGEPITLLVAGDFLDLSLAYARDAIVDLRALLVALKSAVTVDEIAYVVGNHDHHLWSLHSENQRLLAPLRDGDLPQGGAMYRTTPPEGEPFTILHPIVDQIFNTGTITRITAAYPSYARDLPGGTRLYVTHGHLFGGLYSEISDLLAKRLAGLPHDRVAATVNHPIIELIYWHLGEIGEGLGADGLVEEIYTDLQRGRDGRLRPIVERLVSQLLPHGVLWRVIGGLERRIIVDEAMAAIGKALESPRLSSVTAADRHAGVETTRAGLVKWLDAIGWSKTQPTIALYGHTHVRDDYEIPGTDVHSYNLGTWLVEPNHDQPKTGFLGIDGDVARWVEVA